MPAGQAVVGEPQELPDGRFLMLAFEPGAECFNVVIFKGKTGAVNPGGNLTDNGVTLSSMKSEYGNVGTVNEATASILGTVSTKKPNPEQPKGPTSSTEGKEKTPGSSDPKPATVTPDNS